MNRDDKSVKFNNASSVPPFAQSFCASHIVPTDCLSLRLTLEHFSPQRRSVGTSVGGNSAEEKHRLDSTPQQSRPRKMPALVSSRMALLLLLCAALAPSSTVLASRLRHHQKALTVASSEMEQIFTNHTPSTSLLEVRSSVVDASHTHTEILPLLLMGMGTSMAVAASCQELEAIEATTRENTDKLVTLQGELKDLEHRVEMMVDVLQAQEHNANLDCRSTAAEYHSWRHGRCPDTHPWPYRKEPTTLKTFANPKDYAGRRVWTRRQACPSTHPFVMRNVGFLPKNDQSKCCSVKPTGQWKHLCTGAQTACPNVGNQDCVDYKDTKNLGTDCWGAKVSGCAAGAACHAFCGVGGKCCRQGKEQADAEGRCQPWEGGSGRPRGSAPARCRWAPPPSGTGRR